MLETSARLLRLLSLFQGRRYWSGADLAGRLEVTARTLRRDVDKLRGLGYPIRSTPGVEGGYQMGAGSTMPPLLLDDEEAVAVTLGLSTAAWGAVSGMEEASLRALAKIEQLLPARLGKRAAALRTMIVTPAGAAPAADARTLAAVAGACRDQESLRFLYRDHEGKASVRRVEPYRLVHVRRRWYLVAWDTDRKAWRTFRADRMDRPGVPGPRFTPRELPSTDLAAYVARGASQAPPCRARVRLRVGAEEAAERVPAWAGTIEPDGDGSCVFETGAPSYESLAQYLALLGVDFEVSEPAELVREVRRLAQRFGRAAGRARRGGS